MTYAEARAIIPRPESVCAYHYRGGNSHQRRKEQRAYLREFAHIWKLTTAAKEGTDGK
jgi:hypothetical protein